MPEGKNRVTQVVHDLGHPGLSKRGTSWGGQPGSLSSCIAGDHGTQPAMCLCDVDVWDGDASAVKA